MGKNTGQCLTHVNKLAREIWSCFDNVQFSQKLNLRVLPSRLQLLDKVFLIPKIIKATANTMLKKQIDETCFYFAVCEIPLTICVLNNSFLKIMHCTRNLQIIH